MAHLTSTTALLYRRNLATAFRTHIINSPKETEHVSTSSPVRVLGSCSFMYMRHNDVYILAVTKSNANVMLSFQFMTQVTAASELWSETFVPPMHLYTTGHVATANIIMRPLS